MCVFKFCRKGFSTTVLCSMERLNNSQRSRGGVHLQASRAPLQGAEVSAARWIARSGLVTLGR